MMGPHRTRYAERLTVGGSQSAYAFTAWQPTVREALARILPRRMVGAVERESGVALDRPPSAIPFPTWVSLAGACRVVAGDRLAAVQGARERLEWQQGQLGSAAEDASHAGSVLPACELTVMIGAGNAALPQGDRAGASRASL